MSDTIKNIERAYYQGYIWKSDKSDPEVIDCEYECHLDERENPFIIEGQLYCAETGTSYSIKYVDGRYIAKKYNVSEDDFGKENVDKKTFCSNRMDGRRLQFLQYWEAVPNWCCEGMEVNQPAELVFVGFEK